MGKHNAKTLSNVLGHQNMPEHADCMVENRGIPAGIRVSELPFESKNDFSSDPLSFETSSLLIWEDTQKIYDHACIENRFSDNYLKYCNQLEKNIKEVGSLCLTKAVLERNGFTFPQLENMNIRELTGMVSFHLLKCHAALDGIYKDNNFLGLTYLNWEIRWFSLGNRLKATEVKIQKIREGKINADTLLRQEQTFRDEPKTARELHAGSPKPLRINACALPLKGSMAGYMLGLEAEEAKALAAQRREEEKALAAQRREEARWERAAEKIGFMPKPFKPLSRTQILREIMEDREKRALEKENEPQIVTPTAEPEQMQPGELTEAEARKVLIDKAMKVNDTETVLAIQRENSDEFYERWLKYVEAAEAESRRKAAASGRAGPSAEKRKVLRQKRKKRK